MLKNNLFLLSALFTFKLIFTMGSSKEPYAGGNYQKEAELGKDQPAYSATVTYKDGSVANFEGLNINGKTRLKNAFLKKGNNNIPSSINFKKIDKIDFIGKEGTSLVLKIIYKKGSSLEYLVDDKILFGGWVEGSSQSTICTIEAEKITSISFKGKAQEANHLKINSIVDDIKKADLVLSNAQKNMDRLNDSLPANNEELDD